MSSEELCFIDGFRSAVAGWKKRPPKPEKNDKKFTKIYLAGYREGKKAITKSLKLFKQGEVII